MNNQPIGYTGTLTIDGKTLRFVNGVLLPAGYSGELVTTAGRLRFENGVMVGVQNSKC